MSSTLPDFKSMTPTEVAVWVEKNDISEIIRGMTPAPAGVFVDEAGEPMKGVSVRLREKQLAELELRGGSTKEGKSGILRQALDEFFANHPRGAAA